MKKYITIISVFLLASSISSNASTTDNTMKIDEYNSELREAFSLYSDSNYSKALPALEVFGQRGDKRVQYILGTMYLNAQGTEQDLIKSYAWLKVANEQRSKQWERPLLMLESKLPADYLENARVEATKFVEKYGVKAQYLKCRNKKELGSKIATHLCSKSEVKTGYYYVDNQKLFASN